MKSYQSVYFIVIIFYLFSGNAHSAFDWGEGSGACSGDGTFQQYIPYYETIDVGEIPAGKQNVFIALQSEQDVDIQLYDKSSGDKIIHWPDGILSGPSTFNLLPGISHRVVRL